MRFHPLLENLTRHLIRPQTTLRSSSPDLDMYRGLFDQMHDAVFFIDLEGTYLHANRRAIDLLGYSLHELRQLSFKDVSTELPESQRMLKRLLTGEFIPSYERSFRKKDGSQLVGEITAELVRDSRGNPHHIQSIVRDIRQRKQAENILRLQNEYLTVLHHVTLDLLNRRNRDDLLQSIINHTADILSAPYVEVLFKENGDMVTRACTTNVQHLLDDRGSYDETSLVWKAHDTQQYVTIDDYATYPFRNPIYGNLVMTSVA